MQSGLFLGIQHTIRIVREPGTSSRLTGPFWKDYAESVGGLGGWGDGDSFAINYIAHPLQGAITGHIWIQNDLKYRDLRFNESKQYWTGRWRAMGWAALMSTQFEIGPISEASLGNVGQWNKDCTKKNCGMGWTDIVVTPVFGAATMVGEDALDYYVIRKLEKKTSNRFLQAMIRGIMNPSRSVANAMRFKYPWHRDDRPMPWARPEIVVRRPGATSTSGSATNR